ncbi:MAG TPA: DinB family protein [Gemmatimonas sp.]|uniref:DinB family protein n=1 Tax=Gemmatimonas sp. TaxID=1962908 RepID=UPI002ED95C8F
MTFVLDEGLAVLERTPATLRAMLGGLPSAWIAATEGGETWSAFDVVGHLVHGEHDDWVVRARLILAQGTERTFAPYDRLAQFRESEGKTLDMLLDEFATSRAANLAVVRGWALTEEQLALEGVHPAFGAVTLRQLLATWVAHDFAHLLQVSRTMARRYRDDVGPWREYLSVMRTETRE